MGSLIRGSNLRGFSALVRDLGGDPRALLERHALPADAGENDDVFLPFRNLSLLLETCARELDCPDFGLRLSRWQGLSILGPIAVIVRHSSSVLEGIEAITRYLHVHSPALSLTPGGAPMEGGLPFEYRVTEEGLGPIPQGYELAMANGARIFELISADRARPTAILFTHERQGPWQSYRDVLGCEVRFSQPWCGFLLPPDSASLNIDNADPETRRIASSYMESHHEPGTSIAVRTSGLVRRLLPTGKCSTEAVAEELNLHPRTLQRRLAEEGYQYQDLLDQVRRERALEYLASPGLTLAQVAGLLGYAEQSALNRSCRRWFAETPRQTRARLRERPGVGREPAHPSGIAPAGAGGP